MPENLKKKSITLITLVFAGEAIFFLPFVMPRIFRPILLEVFQINNFELGIFYSFYGVIAMAAYFFGGPLADRFQPKNLMSAALLVTGIGGIVMTTVPSGIIMKWIYAFWGVSTILLFWSALQKATRQLGGEHFQGRVFSFLDGGRGLVGALIGTLGVGLLAVMMPDNELLDLNAKTQAFKKVIWLFTFMTFLAGLCVFQFLPKNEAKEEKQQISFTEIRQLIKIPTIWLQAIIIVCAYVGYKITDDFSLYGKEVLQLDDVGAAGIGTLALWMRPIAAISIGLFADKFRLSYLIIIGFSIMGLGSIVMALGLFDAEVIFLFILTLIPMTIGVYGVRGLYFAIMKEGNIPLAYTGSAVGLMSVIGFTPDFFMGPLMGYLLDSSPGIAGHQHVFILLALFSMVGMLASWHFYRSTTRPEI